MISGFHGKLLSKCSWDGCQILCMPESTEHLLMLRKNVTTLARSLSRLFSTHYCTFFSWPRYGMPQVQILFSDYAVLDDDFQGMFDLVFENTWLMMDKYSLFIFWHCYMYSCIGFSFEYLRHKKETLNSKTNSIWKKGYFQFVFNANRTIAKLGHVHVS